MTIVRTAEQVAEMKGRLTGLSEAARLSFQLKALEALEEQGPLIVLVRRDQVLFTPLRPRPGRTRHFFLSAA